MPSAVILFCIIFIMGMVFGRIANIFADYFMNLKKIITHCEKCNSELQSKGIDKDQSFLYLLLKGRCRSCGAKVSNRFPFVEIIGGVLYVIVFMANGWSLQSVCYCLMSSAFLVISIVDWCTYEIPLPCNIFLGIVGILVCVMDLRNILSHIIGFLVISGALYLLFVLSKGGAIGGGDVKLMAVGGLILGWKLVIMAFLLGCIIGAFCHVIRMKVSGADRVLAMGPYLCMGLYLCALWGNDFINWYFGSLIQ